MFKGIGIAVGLVGIVSSVYAVLDEAEAADAAGLDYGISSAWSILARGAALLLLGFILAALGTLIAAVDDDK